MVAKLKRSGRKVLAIKQIVETEFTVDVISRAAAFFGKLDIVVNSAGVVVPGALDDTNQLTAQYEKQFNIKCSGDLSGRKCGFKGAN